ncbi:MAG TPA: peptide chain release factor N(5)-glutamine methyltransferase [Chitinophagaceae bacterium]
MTIHEAQQQLLFQLYHIYDDREAQTITDWVMEHITEWKKIDRIINKKVPLSAAQQSALQDITAQLLAHKPVHYVLHQAWFHGMKFYVDENVLIPRPETEELVEWVVKECLETGYEDSSGVRSGSEAVKLSNNRISILDVGTGSGCIAIALKKNIPQADVFACDVSAEALLVAARNSEELQKPVKLFQIDFLNAQERATLPVFDVIVSNPPYIALREKSQIDRHVLEYEPHTALFVPDEDSLVFYEHLAMFGRTHLKQGGFMMMEIHYLQGEAVKKLFESHGYSVIVEKDLQGNDRMVKVLLNA